MWVRQGWALLFWSKPNTLDDAPVSRAREAMLSGLQIELTLDEISEGRLRSPAAATQLFGAPLVS